MFTINSDTEASRIPNMGPKFTCPIVITVLWVRKCHTKAPIPIDIPF
jgi:hypothetical protein